MIMDERNPDVRQKGEDLRNWGDDKVETNERIGFAWSETYRTEAFRARRNPDMGGHLAALLGKTDLIHHGYATAIQMRRHAEDRPDSDDTGAADTSNQEIG